MRDKIRNDKIIIAPGGNYSEEDREIIDAFYTRMKRFDIPVWY